MQKYIFILLILFMSYAPAVPEEKHGDTSVLQDFINNSSGTLLASLDTDGSGVIVGNKYGMIMDGLPF